MTRGRRAGRGNGVDSSVLTELTRPVRVAHDRSLILLLAPALIIPSCHFLLSHRLSLSLSREHWRLSVVPLPSVPFYLSRGTHTRIIERCERQRSRGARVYRGGITEICFAPAHMYAWTREPISGHLSFVYFDREYSVGGGSCTAAPGGASGAAAGCGSGIEIGLIR